MSRKTSFENPYVSRGGIKLEKAFQDFNISAENKKAADVGSSTGGFTDYLLKNGALSVIAIDVGYGIIAWKLRQDPRVVLFERTNIRDVQPPALPYLAELTVVDLSFISIRYVFKKLMEITCEEGEVIILIKPQFEAKRELVAKGGLVTDRETHKKVLIDILEFLKDFKAEVKGLSFSKIRGAKGNIEFWIYLKISGSNIKKTGLNYGKMVTKIVEEAHKFYELNPKL